MGLVGKKGRALQKVLLGAFLALAGSFAASAESPMTVGGLTSQPIGHYEFCQINVEECAVKSVNTAPVRLTGAIWRKIVAINSAVNNSIKPMSDIDVYGKDEVWTFPKNGVGDCEDYVLEKQRALNEAGISLSDLLITVVRKPDGEGHAVLTVRTSEGDFILDNLSEQVSAWQYTAYTYLKRQSSQHTGRWVSIRQGKTSTVAAVK